MTALVIDRLNRSIEQVDKNLTAVLDIDKDISAMRLQTFIRNAKSIAESNERLWDRISNARKNKK